MCIYLVYCSLFSVAAESMQKWVGKDFPMFKIDLGVSVFCNLIGWYFYYPVGFKKRTRSRVHITGRISCLVKVDFDFSNWQSFVFYTNFPFNRWAYAFLGGPPIKRVKLLKHRPCGPVSQKVKHENCESHDITEILLKVALNTITLALVILLQTIA